MYRHVDDDLPNNYPLALSGLGEDSRPSVQGTPSRISVVNRDSAGKVIARVGDLHDFGAISEAEKNNLVLLAKSDPATAARTVQLKEQLFYASGPQSKNGSTGFFDRIENSLPDGYKLNQNLIPSVPNFALYAMAGVLVFFSVRSIKRK